MRAALRGRSASDISSSAASGRQPRFEARSRSAAHRDGRGEGLLERGHATGVTDPEAEQRVVLASDGRRGSSDFEALFDRELRSARHRKWENRSTAEAWPNDSKWRARLRRTRQLIDDEPLRRSARDDPGLSHLPGTSEVSDEGELSGDRIEEGAVRAGNLKHVPSEL